MGKNKNGQLDLDDWRGGGGYRAPYKPCHEDHPPLHIGGGTLLGGNCKSHTRHANVSVYIALDEAMRHPLFDETMDWKITPVSVFYPITNMRVPNRPDLFTMLIDYIIAALKDGATVHVGCIGGHGRTGLVLAAVVARLGITSDAIGYVREHYCKRAVENRQQEGFLATHFGCDLPPHARPAYKEKVDKRFEGF